MATTHVNSRSELRACVGRKRDSGVRGHSYIEKGLQSYGIDLCEANVVTFRNFLC